MKTIPFESRWPGEPGGPAVRPVEHTIKLCTTKRYAGHMSSQPDPLSAQSGAATADDPLRLDLQLCFALHAASRAFGGIYRRVLRDTELTYPQYLAMLVLWEHGEMPVKQLGEFLRLDSGTLSPLLKRMQSAGLVERERSAHDERSR